MDGRRVMREGEGNGRGGGSWDRTRVMGEEEGRPTTQTLQTTSRI